MTKELGENIQSTFKKYFREYMHTTEYYIDIVDGTEESECPSPCQQTKVGFRYTRIQAQNLGQSPG